MINYKKIFKFKEKKWINHAVILFIIGIFCLLMSSFSSRNSSTNNTDYIVNNTNVVTEDFVDPSVVSYEENLETRLSSLLSEAEGIGNTKVMITLSTSKEIIVAENIKSDISTTNEIDKDGGTRQLQTDKFENDILYVENNNGYDEPLILMEYYPEVAGVIVLAEGGDDIHVKSAIINAVVTILGVEPHKVHVLKMK